MAKKRLTGYLALITGMAVIFLVIVHMNSVEAQNVPAPPGSYTLTCNNIKFTGTPGQTPLTLSATCQTANGGTQQTTLPYDIANCNGTLKWAPNGC